MKTITYHSLEELPLVLCVEDLMPILGIGRCTAYELARSNALETFHVGRQIRISRHALEKYLGMASA